MCNQTRNVFGTYYIFYLICIVFSPWLYYPNVGFMDGSWKRMNSTRDQRSLEKPAKYIRDDWDTPSQCCKGGREVCQHPESPNIITDKANTIQKNLPSIYPFISPPKHPFSTPKVTLACLIGSGGKGAMVVPRAENIGQHQFERRAEQLTTHISPCKPL